jgi:hypothetical protein
MSRRPRWQVKTRTQISHQGPDTVLAIRAGSGPVGLLGFTLPFPASSVRLLCVLSGLSPLERGRTLFLPRPLGLMSQ